VARIFSMDLNYIGYPRNLYTEIFIFNRYIYNIHSNI